MSVDVKIWKKINVLLSLRFGGVGKKNSPSQQPRYESHDQVGLDNMDWSEDGQLRAVSTTKVRVM
jgi:hypothetical protein